MMTQFKIGDTVWVAHFNTSHFERVPCSVCYGKKKVTLILGNGDSVELPCDYCAKGFDAPRGWEEDYQPKSAPEQITIHGIDIKVTSGGEKVTYWRGSSTCHTLYTEDKVFATYEEAFAKGEELKAAWLEEQRTNAFWLKTDKKKNFAWNAGYHMRDVKHLEKQIEYHKEKAVLCKARSKEPTE
jgi:hypothetical protein